MCGSDLYLYYHASNLRRHNEVKAFTRIPPTTSTAHRYGVQLRVRESHRVLQYDVDEEALRSCLPRVRRRRRNYLVFSVAHPRRTRAEEETGDRFLRYSLEKGRKIRVMLLLDGQMTQKQATVTALGQARHVRFGAKKDPSRCRSGYLSCDYARGDHGEGIRDACKSLKKPDQSGRNAGIDPLRRSRGCSRRC
jgi:hypothetical protein